MANLFNLGGAIVCAGLFFIGAAAQSGGQFVIEQSVIAAGGAISNGGSFQITGTIGQTAAGQTVSALPFSLHGGFWNGAQLAPTAANVSVSGRVTTADGRGIRSVLITLTAASGDSRTVISGLSGYFRFTEVEVGATYIFTASAKRFRFSEPQLVRTFLEDTDNLNFVAVANL